MTIGEFLTQYAGAFFGFLGAALAAGLPVWAPPRAPASPVRRAPACWPRTPPSSPSA